MAEFDGPSGNETKSDASSGNVKHLGPIPIDMNHVLSIGGFLELGIGGLSLIAYICIKASDYCFYMSDSTWSFFATMAISTFLTMLIWWLMIVVMLWQRMKVVPWRLGELIILGAYGLLFLIASIVLAASNRCQQGAIEAAAAFGFLSVIAMGVHFYFSFRQWRETERPASRSEKSQPENEPPAVF